MPICAFPLERDSSDVIPNLWAEMLPLDSTKQIGSFVLQTGETRSTGAAGETITGISSKRIALEFEVKIPKTASTVSLPAGIGVFLFNDQKDKRIAFIIYSNGDDTYSYLILNGPSTTIWVQNHMPSHPSRIGFLLENGEFRIWLDGNEVDLSLVDNSFDTDDIFPAIISETYDMPANLDGQTISMQMISDISTMTSPFPAGTEDVCGNTL